MLYALSPHIDYPYNLLLEVKGQSVLECPAILSPDILAGIHYALSTLPDCEQELIRLYYIAQKPLPEIAEALAIPVEQVEPLKSKVVKKLRIPSRWNFIQHGIAGNLKREAKLQFITGYQAGYADGYRNGKEDAAEPTPLPGSGEDVLNQTIASLGLSARVSNCLQFAGYQRIRNLLAADTDSVLSIRNMGRKGADEVARARQKCGIEHTGWYQYLL